MSTTSISPSTAEALNKAAQQAYGIVGVEKGVDPSKVRKMRLCHRVAHLMVEGLVETEPDARMETRGGWTVDEHSYVDVQPSGDLIADGTWQQFVPPDKLPADAPEVLIGTRNEVVQALRSHGVDEITLALWKKQPPN